MGPGFRRDDGVGRGGQPPLDHRRQREGHPDHSLTRTPPYAARPGVAKLNTSA